MPPTTPPPTSRPGRPPRRTPRRRASAALLSALLAGIGLLAGCSGGTQVADSGFVAADGGTITTIPSAKRGEPIDLSGTTLDGETLDVASFRGHPVVLNVWGSWCSPCRKEAPDLQDAYQELSGRDVAFVGINVRDEDRAQALAYERTFELTFPSLSDPGSTLLLSLRGAVAPNAIPTTLVLDDQGRVAARITGPTTKVTLVDIVESVEAA